MYQIILKGEIPSKKNSYRIGKNGGLYKPAPIVEWYANASADILEQRIPHLAGKYRLNVILYCHRDRDLDNSITTICDLLQESGVIDNDQNILEISAIKKCTKMKKPGAILEINLI